MTIEPQRPQAPEDGPGRRGALRLLPTAVAVVLVAALVGLLVYGLVAQSPNTSIDDSLAKAQGIAAPPFTLAVLRPGSLGPRLTGQVAPALKDGRVSPRELRGIPFVLNIWASWCIPCRQEAPELVRAWRKSRGRGVLFVGLNMQDTTQDARDFMDNFGIDYLNVRDPTNQTARRYGATGIPETYFVSTRGDIVGHVIGVVTPAQLDAGIGAAVAGRPIAARRGGAQRPAR